MEHRRTIVAHSISELIPKQESMKDKEVAIETLTVRMKKRAGKNSVHLEEMCRSRTTRGWSLTWTIEGDAE